MRKTVVRAALSALFAVSVTVGPVPMASAQAPAAGPRVVLKIVNTAPLYSVSCVKQGCTAAAFPDGPVVQIVNGEPSVSGGMDIYDPAGIACPSFEQCVVAGFDLGGNGELIQLTDGQGQPPLFVPPRLNAVACSGPTWCVAVGEKAVYPIPDGTVGAEIPGPDDLSGVVCTSAASCVAVGADDSSPADGVVVPITNGVPGQPEAAPPMNAVACPAPGWCVAVGSNTVLPIVNGAPSTAETVPGVGNLQGVACTSQSDCFAVGYTGTIALEGLIVPIINGIPGAVHMLPGATNLTSASCSTSTSCVAVGEGSPPHLGEGLVVEITVP